MKGFIEVTERHGNSKVLCPINKITAVMDTGNGVFIETGTDNDGESTGILAKESFAEIKDKIHNNNN
ncbi:MAG: hypothetical protein ACI4SH_01325 [Candidatus Scatosoma sp.]